MSQKWNNSSVDDEFINKQYHLHTPPDVPNSNKKQKKSGLTGDNDFQTSSSSGASCKSFNRFKHQQTYAQEQKMGTKSMNQRKLGLTTRSTDRQPQSSSTPPVGKVIKVGLTLNTTNPAKDRQRKGVIHSISNVELKPTSSSENISRKPHSGQKRGIGKVDSLSQTSSTAYVQSCNSNRKNSYQTNTVKFSEFKVPTRAGRPPKDRGAPPRQPPPRQAVALPTRTSRARTLKKKQQEKEAEVIDLLDDDSSDSGDDDDDTDSSRFKQQLARTVNATLQKPKGPQCFGELESFSLKELYIGEERFAFAALSPSEKRRSAGAGAGAGAAANTPVDSPVKSCSVTVNGARAVFKFTIPSSTSTAVSPLGVHEEIAFQNIRSIRCGMLLRNINHTDLNELSAYVLILCFLFCQLLSNC
jgi:hypothetical protein